jgi:2-methylcitrate dehydratase
VLPEQFEANRILREDVQDLLQRVEVRPDPLLSALFPRVHACRVRIVLGNGRVLAREKRDYLGFTTRPMGWEEILKKFHNLADPIAGTELAGEIAMAVQQMEEIRAVDLCRLLERVPQPRRHKE